MSGEPTIAEARAARDAARRRKALARRRLGVRLMAGTLALMALSFGALAPPPATPGAGEQTMATWASLRFPKPPPQAPAPLAQRIAELGSSFDGRAGIAVRERVEHRHGENAHNERYLATKRDRTGHQL